MRKVRLAPIKSVTMRRLELTAASVSIRVGEMLKREMDGNPELMYHTDSTTVLRYIANEQATFPCFCRKSVAACSRPFIPEPMEVIYVGAKENPADDASRGLDGLALVEGQRWFGGPGFLWKPGSDWPQQPFTASQVPDDDPEVKGAIASNAVNVSQSTNATSKLINHLSDWHRLRRAVAVLLRFKETLQMRHNKCLNVENGVPSNASNLADQRTSAKTKDARREA